MNIAKFLGTTFFKQHLRLLLLQVLYKKAVPKNFAKHLVIGVLFYQVERLITCNFVKMEGPVQVFCCEFCQISQSNFMENKSEQLLTLRDVVEINTLEIKKSLKNKCSGKRF